MTESLVSQDSPPEDRLDLYLQIAVRQILKHEDLPSSRRGPSNTCGAF